MHLMLKPGLAEFRRTVSGRLYTFPPRTLVEVADDDLPGVADDLGLVLFVPKGEALKPDHDATGELKEMLVKARQKKAKKK